LQGRQDHRLALVHAQRGDLHDQYVLVFVHDEAAQEIALGIHGAKRGRGRQMFLPDNQGGPDAFFEKNFIHLHAFRRQQANIYFRVRIVKTHAEQPLAMVFDLDERAIGNRRGEPEDFAVINPRMAGDNAVAFARFQQDGCE
jgi:hypothetical protein